MAALNWVMSVTNRLLQRVPARKVDIGLALYGYSWPTHLHGVAIWTVGYANSQIFRRLLTQIGSQ